MAEKFKTFLETVLKDHQASSDDNILVVSFIGKDSTEWKKADIVNSLSQSDAFIGQFSPESPEIFIEAYFVSNTSTLYLILHGVHDTDLISKVFTSKDYKNKTFFEKLAKAEYDELSLLHLIFLLSHLVVVIEQGRYFDTSFMKALTDINQTRISMKDKLHEELARNNAIPKGWAEYGRVSCPRMCFLFPERCMRYELPANKKKEISEKLEDGWATQIYNNLKHLRLVDTSLVNCLLILPEDVQYVHVVKSPKEEPRDIIIDILAKFFDKHRDHDDDDQREPEYCQFLHSSMKNILKHGNKFKNFNCFPTLREFIIGAKITYSLLIEDVTNIKLEDVIPELAIAQSIEMSHWERAIQTYRNNCASHGGFFSKAEHETELEKAIETVKANVTSEKLDAALEQVTTACTEYWNNPSHQRCEATSVTGHFCRSSIHSKTTEHDSGFRFLSACNCGKKQMTRVDPFSLKEANYDFYAQFRCCSGMEAFRFPVFTPSMPMAPTEVPGNASPEDNIRLETPTIERRNNRRAKSSASESSKITDTAALSGETIDDEELEDEEVEDVFDRFVDDDKLKELFLDGESKKKAEGDEGTVSNDSENESEDLTDEEDDESGSSVDGTGSYLDNYDDNLKVEKSKTISYEKLLKNYKGQFLECLPHSTAPLNLLPAFPSWALICIGPSNRYSHQVGLRLPHFKHGSDYLLPLDIYLKVNSKDWEEDIISLIPKLDLNARSRRKPLLEQEEGMNSEKVKFFIGFDYECPRGHRFCIERPNRALNLDKKLGAAAFKDTAKDLLESDIPIWLPCTCRRYPLVPAQLMRLHVVTPKAPVVAELDIKVQPSSLITNGYFYPSEEPLQLQNNKYYILRLPFAYVGPDGPINAPRSAKVCGKLFKNWFKVRHQRVVHNKL